MRSPCRFSRARRGVLAFAFLAALSCEDAYFEAIDHETRVDPARAPKPGGLPPEPTQTPMVAIAVYDSPQPDTPPTSPQRFSIANTRDLYIYSIWSALEGEHFETRQFYAPSGELYSQKLIPFSTDIDEPYPFTQSVSIPHGTVIQPVLPNERGNLVVRDQLPILGARIGERQLTGTWRLEVSLDGSRTPTLAHSFELEP